MRKRASLNLSIESIVIVVIAFTVLGLGLAFVKSQIGDLTKTSTQVQANIRDKILEDMRSSGKKLSMTQEISLERGKEVVENVGIVNTDTGTHKFGIRIDAIKMQDANGNPGTIDKMNKDINFFYITSIIKELSPTAGDVIPVTISAKSSGAGNYLYTVLVFDDSRCQQPDAMNCDASTAYDTRSFFVKVI